MHVVTVVMAFARTAVLHVWRERARVPLTATCERVASLQAPPHVFATSLRVRPDGKSTQKSPPAHVGLGLGKEGESEHNVRLQGCPARRVELETSLRRLHGTGILQADIVADALTSVEGGDRQTQRGVSLGPFPLGLEHACAEAIGSDTENKTRKEGREGIEGQGVAALLRMRLHGYNGYESETDCNTTRSKPSTINGLVTDVKLNGQG